MGIVWVLCIKTHLILFNFILILHTKKPLEHWIQAVLIAIIFSEINVSRTAMLYELFETVFTAFFFTRVTSEETCFFRG